MTSTSLVLGVTVLLAQSSPYSPSVEREVSQGQGSLVGCRLWGHTELDTTEVT